MLLKTGLINSAFNSKKPGTMFFNKEENSKLKLYKQTLEQVSQIRYLEVWMDSKFTFGSHSEAS